MKWMYRGREVRISSWANVPEQFQQSGKYGPLVQRALDMISPWEGKDRRSVTVRLDRPDLVTLVVSVPRGAAVIWGVHAHHKALRPGLSPFYRLQGGEPRTDLLTVTLLGSIYKPLLVSVYSGPLRPPLPWMRAVRGWPIGQPEVFWNSHAYWLSDEGLIRPGTISQVPPEWYIRRR